MPEIRGDPAIKLFGRTIPLPQLLTTAGDSTVSRDGGGGDKEEEKDTQKNGSIDKDRDKDDETLKSPSTEKDDRETDANSSQGKALNLKKPDKILPCPRCKSLDTKFCYFNNYNVNQPRHFCKNCQRYWTAGGTMRNVPVGSGRRKSKAPSGPHFHHVTVSDSLNPDGPRSPSILRFGPDNIPISALNRAEQPIKNCSKSGGGENPMIHSSSSDGAKANVNLNGSSSQWPYPWNSAPAFCASSFPIPFYPPTAYWTIPWLAPIASNSPALGKHSRGGDDDAPQVWVPKMLRIDNPDEASKSSIWATMMGAKSDKNETSSGGRELFKKEFQTKQGSENSGVLQANPAALSRSLSFQERS